MIQTPILCSIFLSLLLILGIIFLWIPQYQDINNLKIEIKQREISLQKKEEDRQQLEEFSERLEGYRAELAKIRVALPPSPDIVDFFEFIKNTAFDHGLSLEGISFGRAVPLAENSPLKKTQFSFSFSGSYLDFKRFLSTLQNNARLIILEEISFSSPTEEEIFSFDLRLSTHSY